MHEPNHQTLNVTLDIARLINARATATPNYGIVKYANELLLRLLDQPGMSILPAFSLTKDLSPTALLRSTPHLRGFQRDLGRVIYVAGPARSEFPLLSRLYRPPLDHLRRALNQRLLVLPDPVPTRLGAHAYFSPHGPLPSRETLPRGTARVITIHDVLHLKFPELYDSPGPPFIRRILDSIDPKRDFVICPSAVTRADLSAYLPISEERTRVIHLAADELFRDRKNIDKRAIDLLPSVQLQRDCYILALAQQEPRKNIRALIEAYGALDNAERAKFPLVLVVSHARTEPSLRTWLENARVAPKNLRILKAVSSEDLAALYAGARLFVFPSLYEGFGIPLVEAMAAGCPVVASNSSTHPEVLADAGVLFDPTDIKALHSTLRAILDRTDILEQNRARGLARAASFSWDNTAQQTARYIREITERYGNRP